MGQDIQLGMDTNVDTLLVTQLGFDGYPTGDYIKNLLGLWSL